VRALVGALLRVPLHIWSLGSEGTDVRVPAATHCPYCVMQCGMTVADGLAGVRSSQEKATVLPGTASPLVATMGFVRDVGAADAS
jgi:hypothetical protein